MTKISRISQRLTGTMPIYQKSPFLVHGADVPPEFSVYPLKLLHRSKGAESFQPVQSSAQDCWANTCVNTFSTITLTPPKFLLISCPEFQTSLREIFGDPCEGKAFNCFGG
ncbi:hypothetical protein CEXT_298811 [Caerostris extrusa]|uniref:Uncharacterized protein n=1 Tax=Caerostris extrusa TaxID=172846 RepID=A0AAV4X1I2_CAEEX|nr:hypothetical protein CEXT_298811 [Caerostris extrusa]